MNTWIDPEKAKQRIRQFSELSSVPSANNYPDRDVMADDAFTQASSAPFCDLDSEPLSLVISKPQDDVSSGKCEHSHLTTLAAPRADHSDDGADPQTPIEASPLPVPGETRDTPKNNAVDIPINPSLLRRIIYAATALPESEPPFSKVQVQGGSLVYGVGKFRQDDGTLGRLLTMMHDADSVAFAQIFEDADALLATTNAAYNGETENQRLQDVAGASLTSKIWVERFKRAATHPEFQDMQLKATAIYRVIPLIDFARRIGLDTPRGLALLTERALQYGVEQAKAVILDAVSPLNVPMMRGAVLEAVMQGTGNSGVIAFQRAENIEPADGQFGPQTHTRLFERMRELSTPPVEIPSLQLMYDQIVQAASRSNVQGLAGAIRNDTRLEDRRLSTQPPELD